MLPSHCNDPFCIQHLQELSTVRLLVEESKIEIAVTKEILARLEKTLNGNGQPGLIAKVASHDKLIWVGMGVLALFQFLAGSGIISLKGFIGH